MRTKTVFLLTIFACLMFAGCPKKSSSKVFFVSPKDGDTVATTFTVKFGVEGMTVRPAGEDVLEKTSGHHHILINNAKGYIETDQLVPVSENSIHYGKGEKETQLTLKPGKYKLSMQFADGAHKSYGKGMSATISVTVADK